MTWFGTLTGRLGFTVDHALIYVKGGGTDAHFNYTATSTSTFILVAAPLTPTLGENRFGGTAGFGIEYAFLNNWSAKLEYDYMDFGTKNLTFVGTPCRYPRQYVHRQRICAGNGPRGQGRRELPL